MMLTVFCLLLIRLKAYFDFHSGDGHSLINTIRTRTRMDRVKEKGFIPCVRGVQSLPQPQRDRYSRTFLP